MHGIVMKPLANSLSKLGYETKVISYNSYKADLQSINSRITEALSRDKQNVLVGHSLGGIIALMYAESHQPDLKILSHIITIGSPLTGASVAQKLTELGCERLLGNSYSVALKPSDRAWKGQQKVGSIAGTLPIGVRGALIRDNQTSDGTVTTEETMIDGLTDHVLLKSSHTSLIYSNNTTYQIDSFIKYDKFKKIMNYS